VQNPWKALAQEERKRVRLYFAAARYDTAPQELQRLLSHVETKEREFLQAMASAVEGFRDWDNFRHREAKNKLGKALNFLKPYARGARQPELGQFVWELQENLEFLNSLTSPEGRDEAYILDLIANADRRAMIEGKYEDGVARLYSCLERGVKFRLHRQYGISTEDVKTDQMPEALRAEFVQKRGRHGFTFINQEAGSPPPVGGLFQLRNERRDRYDAVQISARHVFKGEYMVFASYTRSAARSNAVLDFNIDNPLFSQQAGGPLPWDAPNRFISWGWLPLVKGFNLGYSLEWRDGYPFNIVNQDQRLVGPPGSRRFPAYFTLNAHVERRFRLLGFQWALRAGFNDLTNRQNPTDVINNVDSPQFLTFTGNQHRVFTGRIRFLGRK